MKISFHLGRLLAILVIAGLVFAPLSRPANAGKVTFIASADFAVTEAMPEMADSGMSADMSCCPGSSLPMDCDQCPLMALCMATGFHQPAIASLAGIQPVAVRLAIPPSDPEADSLGQPPPPRPPRTPVHSA